MDFSFVDKVELLSIHPLNGAPSGGTEISIKGLNFAFSSFKLSPL